MNTPAYITGTGLYHPPQSISNAELVASYNAYAQRFNADNAAQIAAGQVEALTPSSEAFIEKASGIKSRYVVEKEGVLDPARMHPRLAPRADDDLSLMAEVSVAAAQEALDQAQLQGADIDAVICACANHQRPYPAIAIEVQQALGARGFAYDMNVACSSATFGIAQAVGQIACGNAQRVLVVSPEITSGHLAWRDRDCHFIFGDVCTAVIVESEAAQQQGGARPAWQILGTRLMTQFSNNIRNNAGFLSTAENRDPDERDQRFYQNGRQVFKEVCPMAAEHIEQHLAALGHQSSDAKRFWLHQANINMNLFVARKLLGRDATPEEAPIILDEFANTAAAGSVIAFHRHNADLSAGDVGVMCSFGAGYSIGSVVLRRV
jgi:beta-ketodecanoyl-[acyl-carrier-protein] synthase